MAVTKVEKPVYKKGKLVKIDLYLDYYLKGQKRKRKPSGYSLEVGNSKAIQERNISTLNAFNDLKASENTKLTQSGSIKLTSYKETRSTVLEFIQEMRIKQGKTSLYDNLHTSIKGFMEFTGMNDITFEDIDFSFIDKYKTYLLSNKNKRALSHSSARTYIRHLNTTINYARLKGKVSHNKIAGLICRLGFKNDRKLPDYLTSSEIDMIRDIKCSTKQRETIKQAFLFACYTGLRREDVQSLKWNEIQDNHLYRIDSKTKKQNNLPLNDKALSILQERSNGVMDINGNVFQDISTRALTDTLKRILKPLQLNKAVTFHTARRSFARNLLLNNVPIEVVKSLLNHSDITTTLLYTGMATQHNEDAIKKLSL